MENLPPGIRYLIERSPRLVSPPALVYLATRAYGVQLATRWLVLAMLASLPLTLMLAVAWDEVYIRWDAARRGVVLPPRMGDWTPGSILSLVKNVRGVETFYPGVCFLALGSCVAELV